jgi:hypothetical protein
MKQCESPTSEREKNSDIDLEYSDLPENIMVSLRKTQGEALRDEKNIFGDFWADPERKVCFR